jgi:glucose/arabinose dehydrogenase
MRSITCIAGLLLITTVLRGQTNVLPDIELVAFASGFNSPIGLEHAGDNRMFVLEQAGKIKIVEADGTSKSHFLNITDRVLSTGFEQGLLGIAFDPGYAENGYFYIHYTNLDGNSRFSRFSVHPNNPKKAKPNSEVILLEVEDPFANHNGGQMKFGPDGYLYFTIGDGGAGGDPLNNAQDQSTLLGKLLRIDPTDDGGYDIPPTNPFAGEAGQEEIWATGLRNPWRFSFDAMTGDLWIPDVGQNAWEEVNIQPASSAGGENYGWSCMEGNHFFKADCDANGAPFTAPIAEYPHSTDTNFLCSGSITGGYVYRGAEFPDMWGKYFYTDFCTGVIYTTYWDGSAWVTASLGNFQPFAYSTFGEDISGDLYLVNKTNGTIYRVTDGAGDPFAATPKEILSTDISNITIDHTRERDDDMDEDEMIRQAVHQASPLAVLKPRLPDNQFNIYPNPNHGVFTLEINSELPETIHASIRDIAGHELWDGTREVLKGYNEWELNSSSFTEGVYFIQVRTSEGLSTLKFVVD